MSHPSIILMTGLDAGATLVLDEVLNNFAIGSDESSNLVCSGVSVSPLHASVLLDDEGVVTISDTNSRMGVFVNGARIMEQALAQARDGRLHILGKMVEAMGVGMVYTAVQGGGVGDKIGLEITDLFSGSGK